MVDNSKELSPLVDLMIHEYNERYGLRLFTQPNPRKYAIIKKLAEQAANDISNIINR